MPLRVWALALFGLWGFFARAQVVYLPLDDRPPNWAPCAWGLAVCPPKEMYQGPLGADLPRLRPWLLSTPGKKLVASLDALAYGGLLQSRHQSLSPEDALARLTPLLAWRGRDGGGSFPLWGFAPLGCEPEGAEPTGSPGFGTLGRAFGGLPRGRLGRCPKGLPCS